MIKINVESFVVKIDVRVVLVFGCLNEAPKNDQGFSL